MKQRSGFTIVLTMTALALLAGCRTDTKGNAPPSQVLARVNGDEITVNQLNYLLATQKMADDKTKQALLDSLVLQDLLVQKAVELKLDRDPRVLSSIEFSRRQILAQAAVAREVGKVPDITPADIQKFYTDKPYLFEKHATYSFNTFVIPAPALTDTLHQALDKAHSAAEVRTALQSAQVSFQEAPQQTAAEQLPMPLLDKVATLKAGDTLSVVQGNQAMLLNLESVATTPISLKDATASIQSYIQHQRTEMLAKNKMDLLKKAAKVEYVQQFASEPAAIEVSAKVDDSSTENHIKSGMRLK